MAKFRQIKVSQTTYDMFEEFVNTFEEPNEDIAITKLLNFYNMYSKSIEEEDQKKEFERDVNNFLIQKYTEWCQEFDGRERRKQLKHQHKFRNSFEAWMDMYIQGKIENDK